MTDEERARISEERGWKPKWQWKGPKLTPAKMSHGDYLAAAIGYLVLALVLLWLAIWSREDIGS
nr:hypothetical protein [uncultured Rhodopila sp.]